MCGSHLGPTLAFHAIVALFVALSNPSLVTAFSRTPRTHRASWEAPQRWTRGSLRASRRAGEETPCSSRRKFVGACACGALLSASPARALTPPAGNGTPPSQRTGADGGPSSLPLAAVDFTPTALQESISGFVSGSAVSTVKTLVKYPLDTATVRLQMPGTPFTIRDLPTLFAGSFDGITAPLVSNVPAGAIFFGVKDAAKASLRESSLALPKWLSTTLAVGAALPPYWLVRNPSEVVKTRLQIGAEGYREGSSTVDAFRQALDDGGVGELYQGYTENVLYALPADVLKFVAYDSLRQGKKNLSPVDGAVYGALSTAFAQMLTTPLDVVRNRKMAGAKGDAEDADLSYVGVLSKIAREEGVEELFAGSWPRIWKAMLSGAIQFATYEETKQKMAKFLMRRAPGA